MKYLSEYQTSFKKSADVLVRLTTGTEYLQVAKPILRLSEAMSTATTFDKVQLNYIDLLEKLSYLKGALQSDLKILQHLHLTINMLKSLYRMAKVELTETQDESFIIVKAENGKNGLELKAYKTSDYVKPRGSVSLYVKGDFGKVAHLPDNDWTLTDIPEL